MGGVSCTKCRSMITRKTETTMKTPEEIRQTLWRTLDKLDELYRDRNNAEELLRSEREAHRQEMDNLNAEMAAKDRKLAEKEARIAALEKELAQSKAANVDTNMQHFSISLH